MLQIILIPKISVLKLIQYGYICPLEITYERN